MRKKVLILGLCLLGVTHSLSSKDKKSIPLYKDAKAPIEKRIDDLISRMTLEEKILQLNQYTLGRNHISYFVGAGLFMESGIGRTGMCGICTRSPHVWG